MPFVGLDGELVATPANIEHLPPSHFHDEADTASDEVLALMEGDEEFSDIVEMISSRQATLIAEAADAIADAIRAEAHTLDADPITEHASVQLEVLSTLLAVTFDQSRMWRYQLAAAADRLAADTRRWGAPIPRCTGEEMVLHLVLRRAQSVARPREVRRGSWEQRYPKPYFKTTTC